MISAGIAEGAAVWYAQVQDQLVISATATGKYSTHAVGIRSQGVVEVDFLSGCYNEDVC